MLYEVITLWPGNFIAADTVSGDNKYNAMYTKEDVATFNEYIDEHISRLDTDKQFVRNVLMEMYANPVKNFYKKQ